MEQKRPSHDPIRRGRRKAAATRQIGPDRKCACGEMRPGSLIRGSDPVTCAECQRKSQGKKPRDQHHVAGRNNHPGTIAIPTNDHRAELSAKQFDWPPNTLRNPEGSPLLIAAACIRGSVDVIVFLVERFLSWIGEMLELLDQILAEKLGPKWWQGTPIQRYEAKRGPYGQA
jgi:hypothetical protein